MSDVIDLNAYRKSKGLQKNKEEVSRSSKLNRAVRRPEQDHLDKNSDTENDFGDRMQRIRNSLEKINQLMIDLSKNKKE